MRHTIGLIEDVKTVKLTHRWQLVDVLAPTAKVTLREWIYWERERVRDGIVGGEICGRLLQVTWWMDDGEEPSGVERRRNDGLRVCEWVGERTVLLYTGDSVCCRSCCGGDRLGRWCSVTRSWLTIAPALGLYVDAGQRPGRKRFDRLLRLPESVWLWHFLYSFFYSATLS